MPNFSDIQKEINTLGSAYDVVRRNHLKHLADTTGRNLIVYYSGFLQKTGIPQLLPHLAVNDSDKNGFMAAIHNLEKSRGLDLFLHTPGGEIAATESLVNYLRQMFGTDIRAIVPQLAMSAGTMLALSCREIILGKHSNLGPIDPQIGGMAAHGVVEEFNRAIDEIRNATDPNEKHAKVAMWQPIIAKYTPTLIGQCQKAIAWSQSMVANWLETGMFDGESDAKTKAMAIAEELGNHALNKSHARHIHLDRLTELGLKVVQLEANQILQDRVLAVHHACIHTLTHTPAVKIVENQNGVGLILGMQMQMQAGQAS